MNNRLVFALSLLTVLGAQAVDADKKTQLAVGQAVVSNLLTWDINDNQFKADSLKGQKNQAFVFFPTINWAGANELACNLRDNVEALRAHNIEVIWVSQGYTPKELRDFAKKYLLPFRFVAGDCAKELAREFGAQGWLYNWNRTVLLDKNMNVVRVLDGKLENSRAAQAILNSFGFTK